MIEMCTARYPWPPFTNNMAAMYHVATATEVRCEIHCILRFQCDLFVIIGLREIGFLSKMPPPCLMEIYCIHTKGFPPPSVANTRTIDAFAIRARTWCLWAAKMCVFFYWLLEHYQLSLICRHLFARLQPPKFPENVSELAKNFLSNCLIIDPDGRMKAAELLQHAVSQLPLFVRKVLQTYDVW